MVERRFATAHAVQVPQLRTNVCKIVPSVAPRRPEAQAVMSKIWLRQVVFTVVG